LDDNHLHYFEKKKLPQRRTSEAKRSTQNCEKRLPFTYDGSHYSRRYFLGVVHRHGGRSNSMCLCIRPDIFRLPGYSAVACEDDLLKNVPYSGDGYVPHIRI